ncbi:MAG: hypothetical protein IKE24_08000 [Clostridia bacterium]|nr:hypothetical protein [Clostridia bacterium]
MKIARRMIAFLLTLILLFQAAPWAALAEAGSVISEEELKEIITIAGLQLTAAESGAVSLEARENRYHPGMTPDDSWDARMLLAWLEEMLKTEIYSVSSAYTRAMTILANMEKKDPAAWGRLTGGENRQYLEQCRRLAQNGEEAQAQARYLVTRMNENLSMIEQVASVLIGDGDSLFDYEKIRYSQLLRDTMEEVDQTAVDILTFATEQILISIVVGRSLMEGTADPAFGAWFREVTGMVDEPEKKTVAVVQEDPTVTTLMARLSPISRALADSKSNEATILVLTKQQFAIVLQDKDKKGIPGIPVTIRDLNSPDSGHPIVRTVYTAAQGKDSDAMVAAVFSCSDFVCDFEQEMQLEITVDGTARGYRRFCIPWALIKQGAHRTEILTRLDEPASGAQDSAADAAGAAPIAPYVYSATFNDMDIWRTDKVIRTSDLNDNLFSFAIEVENPERVPFREPELHYWVHDKSSLAYDPEEKAMEPTSVQQVTFTRTKYLYTAKWKMILSPDIKKDQRPYFLFPSTGEKLVTLAEPRRSPVDQPAVMGMGPNSPLRKVFGEGFGLNFDLPKIGGKLNLTIPFGDYLPKVAIDGMGYITVTFGSTLVDPKKTSWKNNEQERFDKGMKQFEHESSNAGVAQKLGTASKYYKYMGLAKQNMKSASFNLGWFLMLSGKWESEDPDDGSSGWAAGGTAGMTLTFSFNYTQPGALGPVPFYVNINFSVSAGFGAGISYRLKQFKDGREEHTFDLAGLVIEIRLAVTVSMGVGIKGIASAWVAATGSLNITLAFVALQPVHVSVTLGLAVTIGFEFFFISYSRVMYDMPPIVIYKNYGKTDARLPFGLVSALADTPSAAAEPTELTPDRYAQLAPKATEKKLMAYYPFEILSTRVVPEKLGSTEFIFSLVRVEDLWTVWRECPGNPGMSMFDRQFMNLGDELNDYHTYDYDVFNDGRYLHLILLTAPKNSFDADNLPRPGAAIKLIYTRMDERGDCHGTKVYDWPRDEKTLKTFCLSSTCSHPQIESVIPGPKGGFAIHGALKGVDQSVYSTQYILFRLEPDGRIFPEEHESAYLGDFVLMGDGTAGGVYDGSSDYRRAELRSGLLNIHNEWGTDEHAVPCGSFIALDSERSGSGKSHLVFYDYSMSMMGVLDPEKIGIDEYGAHTYDYTKREVMRLVDGDIRGYELLQTPGKDLQSYSQTVFYTQEETAGDRTENRLKGIQIGPRQGDGQNWMRWDITYTDYDLTIPVSDFSAVTIGSSQYLYWLSTVPKKKESDPDMWRISGVYYDSSLDMMSDELTIAEFSLPKINGRSAVPHQVTLTDSGTGYITVTAHSGAEKKAISGADIRLYSFPISLKAVGVLKGAALMENVVNPGDTISTDLTVMNEGNMGIGSFIIDVVSVENGREELLETVYANCLYPANSKIVLADQTVAGTGENAFYRYKDFLYAPRKHDWNVTRKGKSINVNKPFAHITVRNNTDLDSSSRLSTNVLVPGALGGYATQIRIPDTWMGSYTLRLKIREISTYGNWLKASELAQKHPDLFAFYSPEDPMTAARRTARLMALADGADSRAGLQRMVYRLDESRGKLVLQNPERHLMMKASAAAGLSASDSDRKLMTFDSVYTDAAEEDAILLYPLEIDAPETVDLNLDVHDIDVGHRVYRDYYGEEMLEITVHNYYQSNQPLRLYCTVYEDDSPIGRSFMLPHEMEYVAAGKTQTITLPLASMTDPDKHEKLRVVIRGIGLAKETANLNNEFEVFLGGSASPEPTPTPDPLPLTGDSGSPMLWLGLILLGLISLLSAGAVYAGRRKKK